MLPNTARAPRVHPVLTAPPRRRRPLPRPRTNALLGPLIYSLVVPFALMDAWVTLYQHVCFPRQRIPLVSRRAYIVIDRHRLPYLRPLEKLNCQYCGYANGVIAYTREVAARTERYWCPIKHRRSIPAPHPHYHRFAAYGDADAYRRASRPPIRTPSR